MSLTQANDFLAESEALHAVVDGLDDAGFATVTQFNGYTITDVLIHLHFWNGFADEALNAPDAFEAIARDMRPILEGGGFRAYEDVRVAERGQNLVAVWIARVREMAPRWAEVDPKLRLPWVGPSMSARSSMTARQMETWAHGFEVFDALGLKRHETDRVKNIVVLGINTFGWTHQVHGLAMPDAMPEVALNAPSGADWTWGDPAAGRIEGPAVDFAAVVTQTRAFADTDLVATGEVAQTWVAHAQCFAGAPVMPPQPGGRVRAVGGALDAD